MRKQSRSRWRGVAAALWIAVVTTLGALSTAAHAQPSQAGAPQRDDAAVRRAWSMLTEFEQADALEEYEARAEYAGGFRAGLIAFALALEERDGGLLPLEKPLRWFDPERHAPGQPIPRQLLAEDSAAARAARERILGKLHARRLQPAWRYDYATREIVRVLDPEPLRRRFENALAGALPRQDLAEAIVERTLDDGAQRKTLAAFDHAYTDRAGAVYPGIRLYDAWSSGAELEMPDVDVLGIVHDVLDEWRKWKAPVPDSQHKKLYAEVGRLFQDARRHRGLRAAYARTFMSGASELEPLYSVCVERLNFAWEEHQSDPRAAAKSLPEAARWNEHLAKLEKNMLRAEGGRERARSRIATIEAEAAGLRAMWLAILDERGAFARTARPSSAPPSAPAGDK